MDERLVLRANDIDEALNPFLYEVEKWRARAVLNAEDAADLAREIATLKILCDEMEVMPYPINDGIVRTAGGGIVSISEKCEQLYSKYDFEPPATEEINTAGDKACQAIMVMYEVEKDNF